MRTILVGSDHAGFELKNVLKDVLTARGLQVIDVGCDSETSCDYPLFAQDVARRLTSGEASMGVLVCGTGIGMSISANRFRGIRAALCTSEFHARMSRAHNDANVLVLGGRVTGSGLAKAILEAWLDTPFEGDRHKRRVDQIDAM
ncbi:MAG: ribose 5-phosphate isomerase B [Desulfomonile sp.]|nr:ribose 5-phosphate isomerase B [Desulfomonile sp.]